MAMDRDATRARIVDITTQLLSEGGLEAIKIRDVAKQAGISIGSVYNLFGDGDDLIHAANTRYLDKLAEAGGKAIMKIEQDKITDVRDRLMLLAEAYIDFVQENDMAWNALLAFNRTKPNEDMPEWYVQRQEMLFMIIGSVLRDTSLANDEERLTMAARALWSGVHGIVTTNYRGLDERSLRDNAWTQVDILVTTFVKGLETS